MLVCGLMLAHLLIVSRLMMIIFLSNYISGSGWDCFIPVLTLWYKNIYQINLLKCEKIQDLYIFPPFIHIHSLHTVQTINIQ